MLVGIPGAAWTTDFGVIGAIVAVVLLMAWLIASLQKSATRNMATVTNALVKGIETRFSSLERRVENNEQRIGELEG